jgi:hypothetical protein
MSSNRERPDPRDCAAAAGAERRTAAAAMEPAAAQGTTSHESEKGVPERRQEHRREGRRGVGRRSGEHDAGSATEQRPTGDRRRARTLSEQREQWSDVSRWLRHHDLVEFRELLERLAQLVFGSAATVMPHLRRSHGHRYLVFVVDAACPEAGTDYESFVPLEQAFWTAYATIPKPPSAFVVAVRPARGWCRSEALMPVFAQLRAPEEVT